MHVDDFGIFPGLQDIANEIQQQLDRALWALGFKVKGKRAQEVDIYIGLKPWLSPPGFEPDLETAGTLDAALALALSRKRSGKKLVSCIVGVFTHHALLWRPALAVLFHVYRYINEAPSWAALWPTVSCSG